MGVGASYRKIYMSHIITLCSLRSIFQFYLSVDSAERNGMHVSIWVSVDPMYQYFFGNLVCVDFLLYTVTFSFLFLVFPELAQRRDLNSPSIFQPGKEKNYNLPLGKNQQWR